MEEAEQTFIIILLVKIYQNPIRKLYIKQILNIMKSVHQRDIIHRDLSPNNILIIDGVLKNIRFWSWKRLEYV